MHRCSHVRFAKGLALAGTPVELDPFSETMLCFLQRGDNALHISHHTLGYFDPRREGDFLTTNILYTQSQ